MIDINNNNNNNNKNNNNNNKNNYFDHYYDIKKHNINNNKNDSVIEALVSASKWHLSCPDTHFLPSYPHLGYFPIFTILVVNSTYRSL